jgi:tetratricopeptide (TPR) repeat protein
MSFDHAFALYRRGAFADASAHLAQIIPAAPQDLRAWKYLTLSLIAQGHAARALNLVETRQQQAGDGLALLFAATEELASARGAAAIDTLVASAPPNSALAVVPLYFAGCLAAADDPEKALALLRRAALGAQQAGALFEQNAQLASIVSQGFVLGDFAELDRLAARGMDDVFRDAPSLQRAIDVTMPASPAGADFIYLCSCNDLYLERFGPTILDAVEGAGIATALHLHVVDPTAATLGRIDALRARAERIAIGYSSEHFRHEQAGGYRSATYYASARFGRAHAIAERYVKDVLILDIDTERLADLGPLLRAMRVHELGYFSCGDIEPWLMCRGAVVYIRRSASGPLFAELLCKYIVAKIERSGFWGLDQAALYVVSRYMQARHPPFRFAELSERLSVDLADFAHGAGGTGEKQRLRRASASDAPLPIPPR